MSKNMNHVLSIDLRIRLKGNVFNFSLGPALRWLVPLTIAVIKLLLGNFQQKSGP